VPPSEHLVDHLRRVLKIRVEHYRRVTDGVVEPCGQRGLMAETPSMSSGATGTALERVRHLVAAC
jgi:hypothetical protein